LDVVRGHYLATLRIPQPASPVDLNADGLVNDGDLYLLSAELLKPAAQRRAAYDLNGDGAVNVADLTVMRNNYLTVVSWAQPFKPRDVNGDGSVTQADVNLVQAELLKPAASRNRAYDLNRDGEVTVFDLSLVQAQLSSPAGLFFFPAAEQAPAPVDAVAA